MESKHQLKQLLLEGTQIVQKLVAGQTDIYDFVKEYNNFYHYNALDGHEDGNDTYLLDEYSAVVNFHKKVQQEVIDLIYLGDESQLQQYLDAGRITPNQAVEKVKEIADACEIESLITSLA